MRMLQLCWKDYVLVDGWTYRHERKWLLFARDATVMNWSEACSVLDQISAWVPQLKAQLKAHFGVPDYHDPRDTKRALERLLGPPWPASASVQEQFAQLLVLRREPFRAAPAPAAPPVERFKPAPLSAIQSWVAITCVEDTPEARPLANVRLQVITAAGDARTASTDAAGSARIDGIAPGQVTIRVLELDAALWRAQEGDPARPCTGDERFTWHTVKQGECLSSLAQRYGLRSWSDLWQHPKNAPLRKKRKSPHVLYPGDEVAVPATRLSEMSRQTEQTHLILLKPKAKAWVRLKLLDEKRQPIETGTYEVLTDGEVCARGELSSGTLECQVPFDARNRLLRVRTGRRVVERPLELGELDPLDTRSGLQARLSNLGYYDGQADGEDSDELRYAADEFRQDAGLGEGDPQADELLAALEREHQV